MRQEYPKVTSKLRTRFVLAISLIGLTVIALFLVIQTLTSRQKNRSHLINEAGRQRMYSQRISKNVLMIVHFNDQRRNESLKVLSNLLKDINENQIQIEKSILDERDLTDPAWYGKKLNKIKIQLSAFTSNVESVIAIVQKSPDQINLLNSQTDRVVNQSNIFLIELDTLVERLDQETNSDVHELLKIQIGGLVLLILILTGLALFVFKPGLKEIKRAFEKAWLAESKLFLATDQEKKKIAREIHDGIGQEISGLSMVFESLVNKSTNLVELHSKEVELIRKRLQQAIDRSRSVGQGVFPVGLSDKPIGEAVELMLRNLCRPHQHEYQYWADLGSIDLAEKEKEALYKIIQESVWNSIKHSGERTVFVEIKRKEGGVLAKIWDKGKKSISHVDQENGMGLFLMRYVAADINGDLKIKRGNEGGVSIEFYLPLTIVSQQ